MKRMNFPQRRLKRKVEAEARNELTPPQRRRQYRLARLKEGANNAETPTPRH